MTKFLIEYDYRGTANGKPVGRVFVTGPHWLGGERPAWSHTYEPSEAATWPTRKAAEEAAREHGWHDWRVLVRPKGP